MILKRASRLSPCRSGSFHEFTDDDSLSSVVRVVLDPRSRSIVDASESSLDVVDPALLLGARWVGALPGPTDEGRRRAAGCGIECVVRGCAGSDLPGWCGPENDVRRVGSGPGANDTGRPRAGGEATIPFSTSCARPFVPFGAAAAVSSTASSPSSLPTSLSVSSPSCVSPATDADMCSCESELWRGE